jgi:hypothetical protein
MKKRKSEERTVVATAFGKRQKFMFVEGEEEDSEDDLEDDLLGMSTDDSHCLLETVSITEDNWTVLLSEIRLGATPLNLLDAENEMASWGWRGIDAEDTASIKVGRWESKVCQDFTAYLFYDVRVQGSKGEIDFVNSFIMSRVQDMVGGYALVDNTKTVKVDTSNSDLCQPPLLPSPSKRDVEQMSRDDLQSLIAARIEAGQKSHAFVAKLEERHEEKRSTLMRVGQVDGNASGPSGGAAGRLPA